jgi:hypothetical protein
LLYISLVLVVALSACRSEEEAPVRTKPASTSAATALVVRGGRLAEVDAHTLEPRGRAVHLRGHNGDVDLAPDGTRAAVGGWKSVRIVDLTRFEVVADLPKPHGYSRLVSWGDPGRIVVVNEVFRRNGIDVLVLDIDSGRLLSSRRFAAEDGWTSVARAAGGSVAFLLHPIGDIGPTRLVHVDRTGRSRLYRLDRIASGNEWVESSSVIRDLWPGLALDSHGAHAYVVAADDLVAAVDLERGRLEYHSLEPSVSLAARLWNWLEPSAEAKASDWTQIGALWLGDGRLALFGQRAVPIIEGDTLDEVGEGLGFRLVDTDDWSVRTVDDEVVWMDRSGDMLLAWGNLWSSVTGEFRGIGLRAYDLNGEELFHVLSDQRVDTAATVGGRALVTLPDEGGTIAVDLDNGRVLPEPVEPVYVPSRVVRTDDP